jgi:hypothetical protein
MATNAGVAYRVPIPSIDACGDFSLFAAMILIKGIRYVHHAITDREGFRRGMKGMKGAVVSNRGATIGLLGRQSGMRQETFELHPVILGAMIMVVEFFRWNGAVVVRILPCKNERPGN